jgi:hypothetical protein
VCFTLWFKFSTKRDDADVPVAWVNCQLFDYKHQLNTGAMTLNMWPDDKANPIGSLLVIMRYQ